MSSADRATEGTAYSLKTSHPGTPNDVRNFPLRFTSGEQRTKSIRISNAPPPSSERLEEEAMTEYREYVMYRRIQEGRQKMLAGKGRSALAEMTLHHHQSFLARGTHVEQSMKLSGHRDEARPSLICFARNATDGAEREERSPPAEDDYEDDPLEEGIFDMDL